MSDGFTVRGAATPEELAVVLALLTRVGRDEPVADGYEHWRRVRRHALRTAREPVDRPV